MRFGRPYSDKCVSWFYVHEGYGITMVMEFPGLNTNNVWHNIQKLKKILRVKKKCITKSGRPIIYILKKTGIAIFFSASFQKV